MIRLSLPATLRHRDIVLRVVASSCKLARTSRDDESGFADKVVSAVSEAFNNVAIHGYRDHPDGRVEIEIVPGQDSIEIRMLDTGKSFNPEGIPPPDLSSLPESRMGLYIIRSLMDEVSYRPGNPPGTPNVLTLSKRF